MCQHQHPILEELGSASWADIGAGHPCQTLPALAWWWQWQQMPVPSILETTPPLHLGTGGKTHFISGDSSGSTEVQCQTGWSGFAGVWWWDSAGFTALLFPGR